MSAGKNIRRHYSCSGSIEVMDDAVEAFDALLSAPVVVYELVQEPS